MSSRQGRGRARGRGSTTPDFLWVNRTPESETLSATRQEREELRTITSHARQWRAALRRQQRLYSAQTEATHAQRIVGWSRPGGNLSAETSSAETSAAPSPAPVTTQTTGPGLEEPFAHLETPDDAWWSRNAFEYAVEHWLPYVFRDVDLVIQEGQQDSSNASLTAIDRIVQGCLANRMHMFSLLAASSGFRKYILKLQLDRHDAPEYCMGKALQHLRHHLSSNPQPNELLIFDLVALSMFERYVGNVEGARTHLSMVQHLAHALGGCDHLEPPMQLTCWLWDLSVAGAAGEAPLMPLKWDPGLLPRDQMREQILPDLARSGVVPSGSALLQYLPGLPPELSTIVVDTVQWFQVRQYTHIHNFVQSPVETWSTRRPQTLVHRLLSLAVDPPAGSSSPLGLPQRLLSECIKQALLVVISDVEARRYDRIERPPRDPTSFSWSNLSRFREAVEDFLRQQSSEDWEDERGEIILWMACLGGQSSTEDNARDDNDNDNNDREWFLGVASDLAHRRGISTPDGVVQLMSRHLHRCEPTGKPLISGLESILTES